MGLLYVPPGGVPNAPTQQPPAQQPVLSELPSSSLYVPPGGVPNAPIPSAYQVKPEDNDLSSVANSLGVPLQNLVDANDGAKTLPPIGSYMATGGQNLQQTQYQQVPPNQVGQSNLPSAINNTFVANNVLKQLSAGIDPPMIPASALSMIVNPQTGQPYTHDELTAFGYVLDPASQSYRKTGVPGSTVPGAAPAGSAPLGTPSSAIQSGVVPAGSNFQRVKASENYGAFVQQEQAFLNAKRWDPERKKYVKIGQLIKEGRLDVKDRRARLQRSKGGNGGQAAAPVAPAGTPETPAQQLALVLGSG